MLHSIDLQVDYVLYKGSSTIETQQEELSLQAMKCMGIVIPRESRLRNNILNIMTDLRTRDQCDLASHVNLCGIRSLQSWLQIDLPRILCPLASGAEFLYYLPGPAPYSSKTISTLKLRKLRLGLQYPVMLSREGKLVHMNILAYLEIAALEISRGLKQIDASIRDIKETRNQHHKSRLSHPWLQYMQNIKIDLTLMIRVLCRNYMYMMTFEQSFSLTIDLVFP
jgi:hypothetical protein